VTAFDWIEQDSVAAAAARAATGFVIAWALLKVGKKRFLKRGSTFDALLAIMVGAVLGRGIAEGTAFLATLVAAAVLMMAHWAFAWLAFHLPGLSRVLEGHPRQLVADGRFDRRQMSRALVSEADIREALRLRTGSGDLLRVEAAWQERNGEISLRVSEAKGERTVETTGRDRPPQDGA
jgi:uncharacterized membrane protein YcaP (DUF421 family)